MCIKYKPSLYNMQHYSSDGNLLLTNTLYNTNVKFTHANATKVEAILQNPNDEYNGDRQEIRKLLVENSLLVNDNCDEIAYVDYLCNNLVYSNDTLHLSIVPTDACNFRCLYCYQDAPKHHMSPNTVESVKKYLSRSVGKYSGLFISWYGGEPLVAKDIVIEIMGFAYELCKQKGIPLYGQMTTNGYNLTPELFIQLQKLHILSYMVTLDGPKETHNHQRPHVSDPDSYSKILTNLRGIRDSSERNNFRIGIRINISPSILAYLNEYVDAIGNDFGNDSRFGIIWEWVKDWGGERICSNFELIMDSYESTEYEKYLDFVSEKGLIIDRGQAMSRIGSEMCIASRKNGFMINYDGKVYKCAMALYDKEIECINCVGEITPRGVMVLDEYKNSLWVGQGSIPDTCGICQHYPECMGLLCPLALKIRGVFTCSHTLNKEQKYIARNLDRFSKYKTLITEKE